MSVSTQSLPKAVQISEMLIREIAAGRLTDGARLPTERQMAGDLGIAVGTLRRALAILEEQGLLDRVQGSGNYVRAKKDIRSVYSFFRLELVEGGGLPSADVLEVLRLRKPVDIPDIGVSEWGHRIRRLRLLSGQPVAYEEIWLDYRFCEKLQAADLNESLYLYYKDRLGLVISEVEDRIGVSELPDWGIASLGIPSGSHCGYVERIGKAQDGSAAEYSRTWFDQSAARYTVRR